MSDKGGETNGGENKVGDGGTVKLDQYLDALANQRRRYILYYLKDEETATVSDIAKHVRANEADRSPTALTDEEYQSVQTELQHKHLPRLADYGLIDFDPRTGDVCHEDLPQTFKLLLEVCHLTERSFK